MTPGKAATLRAIHAELAEVLERHVVPVIQRTALAPGNWKFSLICRDATPGNEGVWVNVTDDDPAVVARVLTGPTGPIVES
jgi:hypothetical protein